MTDVIFLTQKKGLMQLQVLLLFVDFNYYYSHYYYWHGGYVRRPRRRFRWF